MPPGAAAPEQFALDLLPHPPAPTLENFVPGDNGALLAALRAALAGAGPEFLHLWGEPGSGRSHLLGAMARAGGAAPLAPGSVPAWRPGQRIYAVDDVQLLDAAQQAALFALQNAVREQAVRGAAGAPGCVLLTSADAPPAHLRLREDVRTRLAWGLVFALRPIAEPQRAAALLAYARGRGARVDDELVPYMLTRLPRDMRTLVAVLDALDAYALARRSALTVPLLRAWLQSRGPS
jgi:DnaA family protein